MKPIPEHGRCFVCGTENPHSIGIQWYAQDDGTVLGRIALVEAQQGPPGHAHGGALAALLDEAMGAAAWRARSKLVCVNLSIDYRRPVPLGQRITITAYVAEQKERTVYTHGGILLPDGSTATIGKGVYVLAEHLFENARWFGSADG